MKKKSFLAYPYIIWSAIFIVIPLILVVLFSFTQKIDGKQVFSIANYKDLMDPIYFKVFLRSIILAGGSTLICLIVGYPVAYLISKVNVSKRGTLILLFILSKMIFSIEVIHSNKDIRDLIYKELNYHGINTFTFKKDYHKLESIENKILSDNKDKLALQRERHRNK